MKEITILSGKGGTGKTTISAALASLIPHPVFCDNDVDAADLHLIFNPVIRETFPFASETLATINPAKCIACGLCKSACQFDAIRFNRKENHYSINPFQCEGCRLCERLCPAEAITSSMEMNSHWFISDTRFGPLLHAQMGPGDDNSGKLVTEIRRKARKIAAERKAEYIVNDGPPGIGCATIASVTGADAVLLVLEPTRSGLHDANRLVSLIHIFGIPTFAIINKHDLNHERTLQVENFLKIHQIPLLAKIPFNQLMVEAVIESRNIIELAPKDPTSKLIASAWKQMSSSLANM